MMNPRALAIIALFSVVILAMAITANSAWWMVAIAFGLYTLYAIFA